MLPIRMYWSVGWLRVGCGLAENWLRLIVVGFASVPCVSLDFSWIFAMKLQCVICMFVFMLCLN